jgi:hypothetical protein
MGIRLLAICAAARIITHRISLVLQGDEAAVRWWGWRLRKLAANARRRPFVAVPQYAPIRMNQGPISVAIL